MSNYPGALSGGFISHRFVSLKSDQPDPSLVNPSNWNQSHVIGSGAIQSGALGASMVNSGNLAALAVTSGAIASGATSWNLFGPSKPFVTVTPNGPTDGGDYGPNTPGTTTAGIQEAINALPNTGGILLIKANTVPYTISSSLSLSNRILIMGEGRFATEIQLAASKNIDMIINGAGGPLNEVIIKDLTLDGNNANNAGNSGRGINGTGFQDFSMYSVVIQNTAGEGLYAAGTNPQAKIWELYDVAIASCGLATNMKSGFYWSQGAGLLATGLRVTSGRGIGIDLNSSNEIFLDNVSSDINVLHNININACGDVFLTNFYVASSSTAGYNGLLIAGNSNYVSISNGIALSNAGTGFYVGATITNFSLSDVHAVSNTGWGFRFPGAVVTNGRVHHCHASSNAAGNWSTTELGVGIIFDSNDGLNPVGFISAPMNSGTIGIGGISGTGAITSGITYRVNVADIMLTSTSGNPSIAVTDSGGNIVVSGASSLTGFYLPVGYRVSWGAFTSGPTVSVFAN